MSAWAPSAESRADSPRFHAFVTMWCSVRGWDKSVQRGVTQPFILAMQLVTVACLAWSAPPQSDVLRNASFVPFALP
jgi:hypothetical protein